MTLGWLRVCGAAGDGNSVMDGARFAKFAKDCRLLDRQLTTTDVDLIFTKVKAKGQRCITLKEFCGALVQVAEKKGMSPDAVIEQAIAAGGPVSGRELRRV